jgi:hypothetical protein
MAIVAAAKPIAMLRIMMLTLHYSLLGAPQPFARQTQQVPLQRCGIAAPGGLLMNAG